MSRLASASIRREWLLPSNEILKDYDREIAKVLSQALDDVDAAISELIPKTNISARVREAQLRINKTGLQKLIQRIYDKNFKLIQDGRKSAAVVAVSIGFSGDTKILEEMGLSSDQIEELGAGLLAAATRNIDAVIKRQLKTKITLSKAVYKSRALAEGMVERAVNTGLAKGDSAADIAKSVKHMINPNTPGGVSYAAKRLGRTEIVNAFHAQAMEDFSDKPWVASVQWNLSKSHPSGSGCFCEKYAEKGKFKPDDVPNKPHPQCLCFITPNVKSWDEVLADISDSRYDNWLEGHR